LSIGLSMSRCWSKNPSPAGSGGERRGAVAKQSGGTRASAASRENLREGLKKASAVDIAAGGASVARDSLQARDAADLGDSKGTDVMGGATDLAGADRATSAEWKDASGAAAACSTGET